MTRKQSAEVVVRRLPVSGGGVGRQGVSTNTPTCCNTENCWSSANSGGVTVLVRLPQVGVPGGAQGWDQCRIQTSVAGAGMRHRLEHRGRVIVARSSDGHILEP